MKRIYFKDQQGNIVFADVTDEVAEQLKENRREQWRGDAYEEYHTTSLDAITDSGHEFEDVNADIESRLIAEEEEAERRFLMRKLRMVIPQLTALQKSTLRKLFVLNMTQAEIAREEGVSEQAISDRISRIYSQLRKVLKKIKKIFKKST